VLVLVLTGVWLWTLHARAWGLSRRSPVIDYDSAQVALAARELAEHGRLATPFALPVELGRAGQPPWPLAVVQPGLVVAEAVIFRLVPKIIRLDDRLVFHLESPHRREWLTLVIPFFCYLSLGALLAHVTARLLERHAPGTSPVERRLAALTVGLAFLLDPEAQHFAVGGFSELPLALGLAGAFAALVSEGGVRRRPLLFGLLLGVTASFRSDLIWLVPALALAAASLAPERRVRVLAFTLLGLAPPLVAWGYYKWRSFGSPGWDLSRLVVWDGVQGRSWFSLVHLPEQPVLPHGAEATRLLAAKAVRRLPALLLALAMGPRALWAGALLSWTVLCRPPRTLAVIAWSIVGASVLGLLAAAVAVPWPRFLFPVRIPLEAAGMLALWALIARAPATLIGARLGRALMVGVAVLAIGWGMHQTLRGNAAARATAAERGVPSVATLRDLASRLSQQVPADEVVVSNLGPLLAWYAGRPVVHLPLTPADVGACRRRLDFRIIVLAFRGPGQAWPGWQEVVARPAAAVGQPEWNVTRERHWQEPDGFQIVWLELGLPESGLAVKLP
jgi:hypothetical protein